MSTTTTDTDHRGTILGMYAAFGRGDMDTLFAGIADEVDWGLDPDAPIVDSVPWLARVSTKAEVASGYFAGVGRDLEWHAFEPLAVAQDGDHVVSALRVHFTVKATGRTVDVVEAHHFTFGDDGRVVRYRLMTDTAAFIAAFG